MSPRISCFAPVLLCSLLAPALSWAAPPEDAAVAAPVEPAVEEAVVVAPPADAPAVEGPVAPNQAQAQAQAQAAEPMIADEYIEDPYLHDDYVEPYEPKPEPRATLKLASGYLGLGIAPGMTLHHRGFHPNTRFELEFGGTVEHRYRDLALSFGVATQLTPYYERKKPSFGADVTMTAVLGPVYLRTGLGALGGLPRGHLLHTTTAGIGGVVGAGLTFGRAPMIRVGVDYDLRVNTKLEPVHTVFLAVRLACCRKD